jgi:hypothetical protein
MMSKPGASPNPDAENILKTRHRNKRILLVEDDPIIQEVDTGNSA